MKIRFPKIYLVIPIFLLVCSVSVQASLIGETVYGCLVSSSLRDCNAAPPFGNQFSPDTALITDSSSEFNSTQGFGSLVFILTADFSEDTLNLVFSLAGSGSGSITTLWFFEFPTMQQKIIGVELIDSNAFLSGLSFTGNSISIDTNVSAVAGQSLFWDLKITTVPEPSTISLVWLGLSFGGMLRRCHRTIA